MPALKVLPISFAIIILAVSSIMLMRSPQMESQSDGTQSLPLVSSRLNSALDWLTANQLASGSYGDYQEHWTAASAYALWLNNSNSAEAAASYSYLATQMNDSSTWFWGGFGEADVPGAVLHSIASSSNQGLINTTAVTVGLLQFQQSTGGFRGYYDPNQSRTVTSSVDTDMALLGLIDSNSIPLQNRTFAALYLLSLQNPDGSFNLTNTISYDPLYSLGPDPISITALTLLALNSDGFTSANPTISHSLNFLSESAVANFEGNGHVYSAAVSALAFKAYDQPDNAITAVVYILSQQDNDGGFADSGRSTYPESNALDTGWAVIALETRSSEEGALSPINSPPVAVFSLIPQTPTVGVAIHFDASASRDLDSDQLLFIWTFGDGSGTHGSSSIHTYTEAGNFTVTLTVIDSGTNPGPLSDTTSLTMTIQPAPVQKSPTFPTNTTELWILTGAAGAVAIIGAAYYLGRKSARGPVAPTPVTR